MRESKQAHGVVKKQRPYTGAERGGGRTMRTNISQKYLKDEHRGEQSQIKQQDMLFDMAKSSLKDDNKSASQMTRKSGRQRNIGFKFSAD